MTTTEPLSPEKMEALRAAAKKTLELVSDNGHCGESTMERRDRWARLEAALKALAVLANPATILRLLAQAERVRELEAALRIAREAISSCSPETFGSGNMNGLSDPYPIQAELLTTIDAALKDPQP